ncbi:MAG: adenosylhomocysteinase [Dactylosporangium sp.]|nr:hypothetical protein [Dactylosporangium sp.]NNJ60767.1 adenosylhomocysteinase [Dactylosporangium sp.]
MEPLEQAVIEGFFTRIVAHASRAQPVCSVVITHLLAERPAFLRALAQVSDVRAVLPKPRSIDRRAREEIAETFTVDELNRDRFADPGTVIDYLEERAAGQSVVLLDVGGYFASSLPQLCDRVSGQILGVVEDTENGHRRYLALDKPPCPILSVARSPLKRPEDFLVGQSVVFSAEAVMRARGDIPHGRQACVIGFGKVGSSVAQMLHAKQVRVRVYDADPVRATEAMAQGFPVARRLDEALASSGVVVCATGNLALRRDDFARLRNGAYVVSVTSSDDEMELDQLTGWYDRSPAGEHVTRYAATGHYFYVANDGNAVNFLHGAAVGPFIFLVQAEILTALVRLTEGDWEPGYHELAESDRRNIAQTWLTFFNRE